MKDKKKLILTITLITTILVITLGITYAAFVYRENTGNQQLVLGDIYMYYEEINQLSIDNMVPANIANYTTYVVNPIMIEQTIVEVNTLTKCVNFFTEGGLPFDEGSNPESYCKGTGTAMNMTFQGMLDMQQQDFGSNFLESGGQELLDLGLIILDGDYYIVNPIMKMQSVVNPNELMNCMNYFSDVEFDEGSNAESFCRGTGTAFGGLSLQDVLDDGQQDAKDEGYDFLGSGAQDLLDNGIIISKVENLPYFEFTVSGKNEYKEKDIYYEVLLSHGDVPEGKEEINRIKDSSLRFRLAKVNEDNTEIQIFTNKMYSEISNQAIWVETIKANTDDEISNKYRLYMWIDEDVTICGGEITDGCDYYTSGDTNNWNDVFASVKVGVHGDFEGKGIYSESPQKILASIENSTCATSVTDDDGTVYLSGSNDCVNFNYVWYSGKLWRITAINNDGTMKMITDGLMTTVEYGTDNKFYTDKNTTSYMYQWLNQEFLPTLYNYNEIIVENAIWNASPGNGTYGTISSKLPIAVSEEVLVNASVGLLNSYEYYKSYQNTSYSSGYLNIGYYWWLLNPYSAISPRIWCVNSSGEGDNCSSLSNARSVRPSVYLKSTIQLTGGNGTVDNPYRIKGDKENIEENVTLINTRQSGEYVKLVDEETAPTFRIVGVETINGAPSTKLILNDYVRDTNDVNANGNTTEVLPLAFGTTTSWNNVSETEPTYWRGYLNTTWIKEVDPTYNSETGIFGMLEKGTYYLGQVDDGSNYKLSVCKSVNNKKSIQDCIDENTIENPTVQTSVTEYSGLPRYGEMLSAQFGTGHDNSSYMRLITPNSGSFVWNVGSSGTARNDYGYYGSTPSLTRAARPSINLKSIIVIKSGSGTLQDPFIVGLPATE